MSFLPRCVSTLLLLALAATCQAAGRPNVLFIAVDDMRPELGCYGNTGIEAMLAGVPVLGQRKYQEVSQAPIWDISTESFKDRFLELLDSPTQQKRLAEAGREYAVQVHSSAAVAAKAATVYREIMDDGKSSALGRRRYWIPRFRRSRT